VTMRRWTFGQRIALGFALTTALTAAIGVVSVLSLRTVVQDKDRVIDVDAQALIEANALVAARQRKGSATRQYFLTGSDESLRDLGAARQEIDRAVEALKRAAASAQLADLAGTIERLEQRHQDSLEQVLALRRGDAPLDQVLRAFDGMNPIRDELDESLRTFVAMVRAHLDATRKDASEAAASAQRLIVAITVLVGLLGAVTAIVLARLLNRLIGTAVAQVQSSSSELQAAATQQATSSKEQATAMAEISTTISELLATSRQITQSAERVAQIAAQTAGAARAGEGVVGGAHESIAGIRRQVDLIVGHMLELGKKSQEIGGVLDIVAELAEQTNILAINATIEAAGAGEAGRRFGVVADEIRKLADRVAGSAKEIRTLIEEVRSAVNTTVMVTETGSKAVDAGARQFEQVTSAFTQIVELVGTTTDAGREIELSTKQQATAVEQVDVAIGNVAQASRETEASSGQTQQTASQLAALSRDLLSIVRPEAA
jgi:methyl-accepting chemotaxis protein